MQRRDFIKSALGGAAALAALDFSGAALAKEAAASADAATLDKLSSSSGGAAKIRGVNLGAWLVLEKWMVPDIYRGTEAEDEYSLCLALGSAQAAARLEKHRETFITADDFRWIAQRGLNAVRLPVGYWALEAPKPYVENSQYIDFALEQCSRNGLKLLLDLHGAPGSQNGWDHSGRGGTVGWSKDPKNIQDTLRILEDFAQKYGQHPALLGIELLNEPRNTLPISILQRFYKDAYARIRPHVAPSVAVVFHDSFRPFAWERFMQAPDFVNVILDTHLYQCFGDDDRTRTAVQQLEFALDRRATLAEMQRKELPTIVGEWSLSLPKEAMTGLSTFQVESVTRAYASTQLLNYESTRGWFFWSYKLEYPSEWNFRYSVETGWLPDDFAA